MKEIAERIFRQTLAALEIRPAMERVLARTGSRIRAGNLEIDLAQFRDILCIAFGKAAFPMVVALSDILAPDFRTHGIMVVPAAPPDSLPGWEIFIGGHPIPNAQSFAAGRAILNRLALCDSRTLVIFLVSGGGSALVDQPLDPSVTLEDFQALHSVLVTCGAPIEEINTIRKHLSATKGGRLAAAAPVSTKLTLAISDVPPGLESAIASGPTLPDPTTITDVKAVVGKYQLLGKFPDSIRRTVENEKLQETPKENHPAFGRSHWKILLGEHDLTHTAHRICEALGFVTLCDSASDGWPIDKAVEHLLAQVALQRSANTGKPIAVISGGEVSSPVTGVGIGGRNSAFVLACVPRIAGTEVCVLSCGTDGIDGSSPAAGAIADGDSSSRARAAGLDVVDFQRRSDSYNFFARLGDAIMTGPTGMNVRDIRILLMN